MVLSMSSQDDLRPRYPMSRRAFVSMVTAGAASTLIQGTAAARAPDAGEDYTALAKTFPTPPATARIVFDGDEGRLSEAAFLRDFAGDLPEAKAKVLYAGQEEADRKQCPRRFRRSPRRLRLRLSQRQPGVVEKGLAGGGQLDAAHAAAHQRDANLVSRSRIWRLREGCAVCSLSLSRQRQAALLGDSDEIAKVS
jgi:hypothetical protein